MTMMPFPRVRIITCVIMSSANPRVYVYLYASLASQRPMQKSTFFGAFQLQPARRLRDLKQRLYRNKEAPEKMKSPPLSSNVTVRALILVRCFDEEYGSLY